MWINNIQFIFATLLVVCSHLKYAEAVNATLSYDPLETNWLHLDFGKFNN